MTVRFRLAAAFLALIVAVVARGAAAAQSAAVTGIAIDEMGQPVDRALVGLRTVDGRWERTAVSRDDGTFEFTAVPPGSYTLAGTCAGFVSSYFGQPQPGRTGATLQLRDGDRRLTTLRFVRLGVITGTVRSADGEPLALGDVRAESFEPQPTIFGVSTFVAQARTNQDGEYRIFGLAPGDYRVSAAGALADLHQRDRNGEDRTVTDLVDYYPDTPRWLDAGRVSVRPGQERSGIDLMVRRVPSTTISGSIQAFDGLPLTGLSVSVFRGHQAPDRDVESLRTIVQGTQFTAGRMSAGEYLVVARGSRRVLGDDAEMFWGATTVQSDGQHPATASLVLQPGVSVSGRFVVDGSSRSLLQPARLSITARMTSGALLSFGTYFNGLVDARPAGTPGQFMIRGLPPGTYRLSFPAFGESTWMALSAVVAGVETLDAPLAVDRESIGDAIVTITESPSRLSGIVTPKAGFQPPDTPVLVFSTDRRFWMPDSRRVVMTVPDTDGRFEVTNLPAGEYFAAGVTDGWDLGSLNRLASTASRVTVTGAGHASVEIVIR